jgi:hypothetical protein
MVDQQFNVAWMVAETRRHGLVSPIPTSTSNYR